MGVGEEWERKRVRKERGRGEEGERYTEGKGAEGSAMRDGLERGKEKRTSLYFRQFRIEELDLRGG